MAPLSLDALLAFWAGFALSMLRPGPATLATTPTEAVEWRAAGLLPGLGVTLGPVTWGLAAALGVTAMLLALPAALPVLQAAGGIWLSWLAVRARSSSGRPVAADGRPARASPPLLRGCLIHLLNPNAPLGWAAVVLVGLGAGSAGVLAAAPLAGAALIAIVFYAGCALVLSQPRVLAAYCGAGHAIGAALAAIFGLPGLSLLPGAFGCVARGTGT